jgi:hypothetical protein
MHLPHRSARRSLPSVAKWGGLLMAAGALLFTRSSAAPEDHYNEWVKHFYQTQDVSQFDGYWKMVVSDKLLETKNAIPPTIAFASQVLHKYPSLIAGRLDHPAAFPSAQRDRVLRILWLSDTPEARAILAQTGDDRFIGKPPPALGRLSVTTGGDLDFCWGWYFATGDLTALDQIIGALDFGQYAGALKKYPTSAKTEADRDAAMKDAVFGAAMWSLGVNGHENPDIARHIRIAFFDPKTPEKRKIWLGEVVVRASPDITKQEFENNKAGH